MTLPDTRITLLQRLHDRQDSAAWMEFCAIYERAIYRIAVKYGLQDADAREISQEVLLTVSRKIHEFDLSKEGRFRSWLSTVARNATVDLLRKAKRLPGGDSPGGDSAVQRFVQQLPAPVDESTLFDRESRTEQFRWAAEQVRPTLAESTWQAFYRTAVLAEDKHAVAKDLGLSVGAVYVARCRTLAKIKQLVVPYREPGTLVSTSQNQNASKNPAASAPTTDNDQGDAS